jgi:hypothetical protein
MPSPDSTTGRIDNVNEAFYKVSTLGRFMLESSPSRVSSGSAASAAKGGAFGLFPNFSTAVEKTVENQWFVRFHATSCINLLVFLRCSANPPPKAAKKLPISAQIDAQASQALQG